jgi:hypothetical protein
MPAKHSHACLLLLMMATWAIAAGAAPVQPCPISYSALSMPYMYPGGMSTPVLQLGFTNVTGKKIVRAKFGLSVTGPDGNEVPYEQGLTFIAGADPGKITTAQWELDAAKVDIHHSGEVVYLKSVRFEDKTSWQDDGNEHCRDEVNWSGK